MQTVPKKKILYIVTKSNFGGAQRYVFDLATHLDTSTYTPIVAFGGQGTLKEKLEHNHIRTISIPKLERDIHLFKEFSVLRSLYQLYKREQPDIVHVNSSKSGGLGALAGRLYNLTSKEHTMRIIFTAHGWPFKERVSFIKKLIRFILSWITTIFAHAIIVVSKDDRHRARFFIGARHKIHHIYNGIAPYTLHTPEQAQEIISKYAHIPLSEYKKSTCIISIGELTKNKGFRYGITALTTLPKDFIYIIIGDGEDRERLEQHIRKQGLQNRVFMIGYIRDASTLLSGADIFLLPSEKEGLPYVLLEALYAHIPMVASHIGGIPEILKEDSGSTLAPVGDPSAIAHAIKEIVRTHKKQNTSFPPQFTLTHMCHSTEALYR